MRELERTPETHPTAPGRPARTRLHRLATFAALCVALGCSGEPDPAPTRPAPAPKSPAAAVPAEAPPEAPMDPKELAEKGRQVYLSSCIACHNADPTKDGALGPAVAGSSYELLEARVMRSEYPEGYTPKRETAVMIAMPFLEKQLPALAAYLAAEG